MRGKVFTQKGVPMCRIWCPDKNGYVRKRLFPQSDVRYKDHSLAKPRLRGAWLAMASGKIPTPVQVELRADELDGELKSAQALGEMEDVTKAELAKRHRAKTTNDAYAAVYGRWLTYHKQKLGSIAVHLVSRKHIEGYLSWRKDKGNLSKGRAELSDSTLERDLAALRVLFAGLVEEGLIERSPCASIKIKNKRERKSHKIKRERREKVYTEDEMKRMLAACKDEYQSEHEAERGGETVKIVYTFKPPRYLYHFVRIMSESGLRVGELLDTERSLVNTGERHKTTGLLWRDVDLEGRVIHVDGKTGSRPVVVTPELQEALSEWKAISKEGKVFDIVAGSFRKAYSSALERAGIEHKTVHDLRHTCATRWLDRGYPLKWVSSQLGHTSLETTMIYVHDDVEVRQREVERVASLSATRGVKQDQGNDLAS